MEQLQKVHWYAVCLPRMGTNDPALFVYTLENELHILDYNKDEEATYDFELVLGALYKLKRPFRTSKPAKLIDNDAAFERETTLQSDPLTGEVIYPRLRDKDFSKTIHHKDAEIPYGSSILLADEPESGLSFMIKDLWYKYKGASTQVVVKDSRDDLMPGGDFISELETIKETVEKLYVKVMTAIILAQEGVENLIVMEPFTRIAEELHAMTKPGEKEIMYKSKRGLDRDSIKLLLTLVYCAGTYESGGSLTVVLGGNFNSQESRVLYEWLSENCDVTIQTERVVKNRIRRPITTEERDFRAKVSRELEEKKKRKRTGKDERPPTFKNMCKWYLQGVTFGLIRL